MTVIMDDGTYSLLRKHYIAMLDALSEIKGAINSDRERRDNTSDEAAPAIIAEIEEVAARASTVSLFNAYNRPRYATEEIQKLPSPEECNSPLPVV